jgi:hypothetical protein
VANSGQWKEIQSGQALLHSRRDSRLLPSAWDHDQYYVHAYPLLLRSMREDSGLPRSIRKTIKPVDWHKVGED